MILGTHNSGSSGKLVWWQRPFSFLLNLTSRCQRKSIKQQLSDGVKLFNLQVAFYNGEWHFSHGLCIYKEKLIDSLIAMKAASTIKQPIYFQLYLDKSFFCKQQKERFQQLVNNIKEYLCSEYFVMLSAGVEGSNEFHYKAEKSIDKREHYWTLSWSKAFGKCILDFLPLPLLHAKRYNKTYKQECASRYLMLDFYDI